VSLAQHIILELHLICMYNLPMNNHIDSSKPLRRIEPVSSKRVTLSERRTQTFRLSIAALNTMVVLANKLGIGRTAVLELAVRDLAKREEIKF